MLVSPAALDDADSIAHVYVTTWLAAYRGILPDRYLAALSLDRIARRFRSWIGGHDHVVLVARDEFGDITAFSSGGPESNGDAFFRGEIYTLYVTPAAQGRGIGRALVDEMRARLPWTPILVWVLEENAAARAFYEKTGAVPVRRRRETIGGRDVAIVGYAWFDVDA